MEQATPATKRARSSPPQAHAAAVDVVDRLSALDDGTLHAILDRLPVRDAAATTALSRRWPRVFATLPRICLQLATFNRRDFPDEGDEDYCEDAFRWMALACVLDGRAAAIALFDVCFKYMGLYQEWFLDFFRELCGSGGLRELSITNTKYTEFYSLPTPVYNCKTLVSLELYNWRIRVPGRVTGLRSLQSLSLRNVVATDAEIRRMISPCRDMARLEIMHIHKARNIVIQAPNLEKLEIYSFRPLCVSVKKAPRLESVRLSLSYFLPGFHWRGVDTMDTDEDLSFSEIDERCDFQKMSEREYKTDEVRNMVTFLGGLRCAKNLGLYLPPEYATVLSMAKVPIPKRLPKKCYLLGLRKLVLTLDHNDEVLATIVSCLFNSSPNLKDLRIHGSHRAGYAVPLAAEFWEEQIDADCCVQNHLSTVTFYIDSFSQSNPCRGLCQFLVMNARVLQRVRIEYIRRQVKPANG